MFEVLERKIEQYVNDLNDRDAEMLYRRLPAGKRLRARLILSIAGRTPAAVKTAAIVEMIHAASLLHDDVIDDAYMRRGQPSINAVYGNKTSVMFGDVLYSKAFYELADLDRPVARIIASAVIQLSLGERSDVLLSETFNTDREAYLHMIYQKTASLIEAAAEAAAVLAGKNRMAYRTYGRNLGIAFQMMDDLLDITQSSEQLGKPAMHDYEEGKTTLPYIYLYESLDDAGRQKLMAMHGRPVTEKSAKWIRDKMTSGGILERARNEAETLIGEAIDLMRQEKDPELEAMALKMIKRDY
jgi:octaprenyl-diphosphate synthase